MIMCSNAVLIEFCTPSNSWCSIRVHVLGFSNEYEYPSFSVLNTTRTLNTYIYFRLKHMNIM